MLQAPGFDCFLFDPFSFVQSGLATSEVYIGGCEVIDALVITLVIIVINKSLDLDLEVFRKEVVFQQDAVFQGLMPSLVRLGLTRPHRGHGPCSLPWVCG